MSFSTICATDLFYVSKHTLISWNKFLTIRFLHTRKHIVYNAIVKREEIKKEKTACNNVAFVGRLSEEKRPEIFCEIAKHYPQKKFFLWGNGPLYDSLKEKYQSYVTFKGYTNDISEIYSNMDLLCVCSTIENCPMCILEARGYGIPCISTKVGGIPEILQEGINGEFFEGNNPVFSFALAMEKIEKRYKEYVKACYETSKDYSLDMIGKRWNVIINK